MECHIDHKNERWWVLRNGRQTCCCCGAVMKPKEGITRNEVQDIAKNIADVYPGKKIIILMPGDKIPEELKHE